MINADITEFLPAPSVHNFVDITGQTFNRLKVLGIVARYERTIIWLCQCNCGKRVQVRSAYLRNGHTKSCGCFKNEMIRERSVTHGLRHSSEFMAFHKAKERCQNPKCKSFPNYGGRGIEFRFQTVEEFIADIGIKPSAQHSIERINNEGHYEKGNVKWGTKMEQANNTRASRRLTLWGRTQTLAQWCREFNVLPSTVLTRIKRKRMSMEEALTAPIRQRPL